MIAQKEIIRLLNDLREDLEFIEENGKCTSQLDRIDEAIKALQAADPLRYAAPDCRIAECPCCGSLDVGGAHDTVHCQSCGLSITCPRPLQNAIDAWNTRKALPCPPAKASGMEERLAEIVSRMLNTLWSGKSKAERVQLIKDAQNTLEDYRSQPAKAQVPEGYEVVPSEAIANDGNEMAVEVSTGDIESLVLDEFRSWLLKKCRIDLKDQLSEYAKRQQEGES